MTKVTSTAAVRDALTGWYCQPAWMDPASMPSCKRSGWTWACLGVRWPTALARLLAAMACCPWAVRNRPA